MCAEQCDPADCIEAMHLVLADIQFAHLQCWRDFQKLYENRHLKMPESLTGLLVTVQDAMQHKFRSDPHCHEKMPFHVLVSWVLNLCPPYQDVKICRGYLLEMANALWMEYRFTLLVERARNMELNDNQTLEDRRCLIYALPIVTKAVSDAKAKLFQYLRGSKKASDWHRDVPKIRSDFPRFNQDSDSCKRTSKDSIRDAPWSRKRRRNS